MRQCFILCLLVLTTSLLQGDEKLYFPLDGRQWNIGYQEKNDEEAVFEMILQDEEMNDWTELLTFQRYNHPTMTAQGFIDQLEESIKKNIKKPQKLKFQILETDPVNLFESTIIFERSKYANYSIIGYDEYNLGRVLRGKSEIFYIRYSSKDKEQFEKDKEDWVERLGLAYIANAPHPSQEGDWITLTSNGFYRGDQQMIFQPSKQYIDYSEYGYSFTLPKTWLLEKQNIKETSFDPKYPYTVSLLFSTPDRTIYGGTAFLDTPKEEPSFDPRSYYWTLFHKQYPNAKEISKGELQTVLGLRGSYLIIEQGGAKGWVTFYQTPERIYRLELWTKVGNFEKSKSEIEKISLNFETRKKIVSPKTLSLELLEKRPPFIPRRMEA